MNADRLARCIGEVDEALLEQALLTPPPKKKRLPLALGTLAACLTAALLLHLGGILFPIPARNAASLSADTPGQTQPQTQENPPSSLPEDQTQQETAGTAQTAPSSQTQTSAGTQGKTTSSQTSSAGAKSAAEKGAGKENVQTAPAITPRTTTEASTADQGNEGNSPSTGVSAASAGAENPQTQTSNGGTLSVEVQTDGGFLPYDKDGTEIGVTFSWEGRPYTMAETLPAKPAGLTEVLGTLAEQGTLSTENPNLNGGAVYRSGQTDLVVELEGQYALFRETESN